MLEKGFKLEDVKELAKDFLEETYKMELDIPIIFKRRIGKRWGYFTYSSYEQDVKINGKQHKKGEVVAGSEVIVLREELRKASNLDVVEKIIKHELVHYVFYKKGIPFGDDDEDFNKELERLHLTKGVVSREMLGLKRKVKINFL